MTWLIFAFLSTLSYCLVSVCIKFSIGRVDTTLLSTIQICMTSIILIVVTLITSQQPPAYAIMAIEKKDWFFITLSAFAYSASWIFYFAALKYGFLAKVTSIERLDFVIMMILSALFFGEQISGKMLVGATLMLIGVFLVAQD